MDFKEFFEDLDEIINGGMFSNLGTENMGSFMTFLDEGDKEGKTHRISDNNDSPNYSTIK